MNELIVYPAAIVYVCAVPLLAAAAMLRLRAKRRDQLILPEEFEDHPAFHGEQQYHFMYSVYIFTKRYGLLRMRLHFEHFPTLDDIFRAVNLKYSSESADKIEHFQKVIWNLGLPEKPNDFEHSRVEADGNSVTVYKDMIVEN